MKLFNLPNYTHGWNSTKPEDAAERQVNCYRLRLS
jgi:hypothetical protein